MKFKNKLTFFKKSKINYNNNQNINENDNIAKYFKKNKKLNISLN